MFQLNFGQLILYNNGDFGVTLPVTLAFGTEAITLSTKVDTGSTFCIFERRAGEVLGLDIETGLRERIGTAMGSFTVFGHEVTLKTAGLEFDSVVFFAADEYFNRNVLGRFGWLDRVIIGLNDYEGKLYLNRYEPE